MADENAPLARGEASLSNYQQEEHQALLDEERIGDDGRPFLVVDPSWVRPSPEKKEQQPALTGAKVLLLIVAFFCTVYAFQRLDVRLAAAATEKASLSAGEGGGPSSLHAAAELGKGEGGGGLGLASSSSVEDSSSSVLGGPRLSHSSTSSGEAQDKEGAPVGRPGELKAAGGDQKDAQITSSGAVSSPPPTPSAGEQGSSSAAAGGLFSEPFFGQPFQPSAQTFLGSIVPSFSGWPVSAQDLKNLVEGKEGAEAAAALESLMKKQLPAEESLPFNTESLSTTMLEIRKQQLLSMAYQCFALRRDREQRYLALRLMEKALPFLEKGCRGSPPPGRFAELMAAYQEPVDMAKEKRELARVKLAYEESLMRERVALDRLYYYLNEMAGHVAAVELFVTMDTSTNEWKEKMPRFKDAGSALNELKNLVGSDLLSSGPGMLSLASSTAKARKQVFASDTAAFKAVAKLADIVRRRRDINRYMRLAADPKAGNLDERTAGTLQKKTYEFTDKLEAMQADTRNFLRRRQGQPIELESWLAIVL
ncbi:hypothetical protein Emed_003642 [Eimeria media]